MKKSIIIMTSILLLCLFATLVFAIPTPNEKAGKEIDKAVQNLPDSVSLMLNDSYKELFPKASFSELIPSDGYRIHVLDSEKIVALNNPLINTVIHISNIAVLTFGSIIYWKYLMKKK